MPEDKHFLAATFEKFERSLPKHLQPHAFKIIYGASILGLLLFIGYEYGWTELSAFILVSVLIPGAVALWMFVKWLFTGRV